MKLSDPESGCQPPASWTPGPSRASPASDSVCTAALIQAPLMAGTTRTTTRCRRGGQDARPSPGGSTQADSMTPSSGGTALKSGGTARATGHSAATVARVRSQSASPSAAGRNIPLGTSLCAVAQHVIWSRLPAPREPPSGGEHRQHCAARSPRGAPMRTAARPRQEGGTTDAW